MTKHKFFNGRKYYLHKGRWYRTIYPNILLSHDTWNFYNPNDIVKDNEIIHHINGDKSDDNIKNLQKMTRGEHTTLHHIGKSINKDNNNPRWKGGMKFKALYLGGKQVNNQGYKIYQHVNSLGEVLSSEFKFSDRRKNRNG